MAYYGRCLWFLFLSYSFFLLVQARESKLFSKVPRDMTKNSKENTESPIPESKVKQHGYRLYEEESNHYPSTTMDPLKDTSFVGEEKNPNFEEFGNGNEKQGMSDTRFLENGRYYYDVNQDGNRYGDGNGNGNGNGNEKQGMSDTRFLENGKYYYDINQDVNDENHYYPQNMGIRKGYGNGNGYRYETERHGMSENNYYGGNGHFNKINNNNELFEMEREGMSDTKFTENEKYYYDINNDIGESLHVPEERGVYNYNTRYKRGVRKLPPNEYDTMEEYEQEEENKHNLNGYKP